MTNLGTSPGAVEEDFSGARPRPRRNRGVTIALAMSPVRSPWPMPAAMGITLETVSLPVTDDLELYIGEGVLPGSGHHIAIIVWACYSQ